MPALHLMLSTTYYAQTYADIIGLGLVNANINILSIIEVNSDYQISVIKITIVQHY